MSFGTAPLGDMFGAADHDAALKSVHQAVESGINFFDSSPYYGGGLAEERLGAALKGDATKSLSVPRLADTASTIRLPPARIRDGVHRSLQLLQTDTSTSCSCTTSNSFRSKVCYRRLR